MKCGALKMQQTKYGIKNIIFLNVQNFAALFNVVNFFDTFENYAFKICNLSQVESYLPQR